MQRFITKRVLSSTNSLRSHRCFSQLAPKQTSFSVHDNDIPVPKLPPFDYSPPPYTGPSADQILAKRKQYLSPSLFHFFSKPVSLHHTLSFLLPYHFSSFLFSRDKSRTELPVEAEIVGSADVPHGILVFFYVCFNLRIFKIDFDGIYC